MKVIKSSGQGRTAVADCLEVKIYKSNQIKSLMQALGVL